MKRALSILALVVWTWALLYLPHYDTRQSYLDFHAPKKHCPAWCPIVAPWADHF